MSSRENEMVMANPAVVSAAPKIDGQDCASVSITQEGRPGHALSAGQLNPEDSHQSQVVNRLTQRETVGIKLVNAPGPGTSQLNGTNTERDIPSSNKPGPNPQMPLTRSHIDGVVCDSDPSMLPSSLVPSSTPSSKHIPQPHHGLLEESQMIPDKTMCDDMSNQAYQSASRYLYPNNGPQANGTPYNAPSDNILPHGILLPPKPPNTAVWKYKWNHHTNEYHPSSSLNQGVPLLPDKGLLHANHAHPTTNPPDSHAQVIGNPTTASMSQHVNHAFQQDLMPEETVCAPSTHHVQENDTLEREKKMVSEGKTKRYPAGSRVFIGNLSKSVRRKDIYELFSKHGRVEEISLKNESYGFAQYLTPAEAEAAIHHLQGRKVGGQKINLEIAHEQTKNGERNRGSRGKRDSDHNRARKDDHRLGRRPSPRHSNPDRNNRGRNRGEESYSSDRRRSQSPRPNGHDPYTFRQRSISPSPRHRQRATAPDVHLLLYDVNPNFISWVHDELVRHGLAVDSSILDFRMSRDDVTMDLVVKGVRAVVLLDYTAENRSLMSMDLFDRQEGTTNVKHEQYRDLRPEQIAQIVLRQRQAQRSSYGSQYPQASQAAYPPTYVPPFHPSNQTYPSAIRPNTMNQLGDPGMIQNLLATLGSNPQGITAQFPTQPPPNMVHSGVPHSGNAHPQLQSVLEQLAWPR
ncbi:hypothetical protein F5Y08DRAFT_342969 [Xylaria arbuscula]|nr:hypothetical protein F5Y08DRAFT_342969 [Xylaria arbuscula]